MRAAMLATAMLTVAGPAVAQIDIPAIARQMGQGLSSDAETQAIAAATDHPLGSRENPVRADGPYGERAYLARLRCPNGAAPSFTRVGSAGNGPYRFILDDYAVTCRDPERVSHVFIDMYHHHVETRAVPDFTVVAPR